MTEQRLYRRIVRRSTFRSRSTAVIVTLTAVAVAAAYAGVESVLAALDLPPLLVAPADVITFLDKPEAFALGIAAAAAVLGVVLIIAAVAPGRRGRHELPNGRMAVLVDDGVLAGAIGAAVTREAGLPASRVASLVSRSRSVVRVTPTSGSPLDHSALEGSARTLVGSLDPRPALRATVEIAPGGVVGS